MIIIINKNNYDEGHYRYFIQFTLPLNHGKEQNTEEVTFIKATFPHVPVLYLTRIFSVFTVSIQAINILKAAQINIFISTID